jgi:hypothetical protein
MQPRQAGTRHTVWQRKPGKAGICTCTPGAARMGWCQGKCDRAKKASTVVFVMGRPCLCWTAHLSALHDFNPNSLPLPPRHLPPKTCTKQRDAALRRLPQHPGQHTPRTISAPTGKGKRESPSLAPQAAHSHDVWPPLHLQLRALPRVDGHFDAAQRHTIPEVERGPKHLGAARPELQQAAGSRHWAP